MLPVGSCPCRTCESFAGSARRIESPEREPRYKNHVPTRFSGLQDVGESMDSSSGSSKRFDSLPFSTLPHLPHALSCTTWYNSIEMHVCAWDLRTLATSPQSVPRDLELARFRGSL